MTDLVPTQLSNGQEKTQSITFRLPHRILEQIELEAKQNNISENVLVKQILTNYVDLFRVTRGILEAEFTCFSRHSEIAGGRTLKEI